MDLGATFTRRRDGEWLEHQVVWTGKMPINPPDELASMPSSLLSDGVSRQPAKRVACGKAGTSVMQQTVVGKGGSH